MRASTTLAAALWTPGTQTLVSWRWIALALAGIALLTISAKIQVPFWPVPMSLSTLGIMVVALGYGVRLGGATILGYLAVGFAGAPVFVNAGAGPAYFMGPTGGFLVGFVVGGFIIAALAERGWSRNLVTCLGALLLGNGALFACGLAYLTAYTGSFETAVAVGLQPFLLGEALKIGIAAVGAQLLWSLVDRRSR